MGHGLPVFRSGHQRSLAVERGGLERASACSASLRVARCGILGGCTRGRSRISCGILVCWFGNVRLGSCRVSSRSRGVSRTSCGFGIRRRGGCIGRTGCRGCVRLAGVRCRRSISGGWRSGGLGGSIRCRGRRGGGTLIGRLGSIRLSSGVSSRCCSAGCAGCRCGIRRRLGGGLGGGLRGICRRSGGITSGGLGGRASCLAMLLGHGGGMTAFGADRGCTVAGCISGRSGFGAWLVASACAAFAVWAAVFCVASPVVAAAAPAFTVAAPSAAALAAVTFPAWPATAAPWVVAEAGLVFQ